MATARRYHWAPTAMFAVARAGRVQTTLSVTSMLLRVAFE